MQSVREATILLIRENGNESVTTADIAERAGISIGSLYHYYPNKQAILTDIYETILDRLNAELRQRLDNESRETSLETQIRDGLELTVSLHRQLLEIDANFYISFFPKFNITDHRGPDKNYNWDSWAELWLAELLEKNRSRLRRHDIPAMARFMVDMTSGTIHRIATTRPEALNDSQLVEQLADLICRYLFINYSDTAL